MQDFQPMTAVGTKLCCHCRESIAAEVKRTEVEVERAKARGRRD